MTHGPRVTGLRWGERGDENENHSSLKPVGWGSDKSSHHTATHCEDKGPQGATLG